MSKKVDVEREKALWKSAWSNSALIQDNWEDDTTSPSPSTEPITPTAPPSKSSRPNFSTILRHVKTRRNRQTAFVWLILMAVTYFLVGIPDLVSLLASAWICLVLGGLLV